MLYWIEAGKVFEIYAPNTPKRWEYGTIMKFLRPGVYFRAKLMYFFSLPLIVVLFHRLEFQAIEVKNLKGC